MRLMRAAGGFLALTMALVFIATPASAQRRGQRGVQGLAGKFGLGIQLGQPTGLSYKYWTSGQTAVAGSVALNFKYDAIFADGHYLWHKPLDTGDLNLLFHYGPGLFLAIGGDFNDDKGRFKDKFSGNNSSVGIGVGGSFGLDIIFPPRFDVYLQIDPKLLVVPTSAFDLGLALGGRFYF